MKKLLFILSCLSLLSLLGCTPPLDTPNNNNTNSQVDETTKPEDGKNPDGNTKPEDGKNPDENTKPEEGKNPDDNAKPEENGIIEVNAMPFDELKVYTFEPSKRYRVHLNQDCMSHGIGTMENPANELQTFLTSKTNIVEVVIDNGVKEIGMGAFYGCSSLTSITIPDSVTSIGDGAFSICSKLTNIKVSDNNQNYSSSNGVLYNKDKSTLVAYPVGKTETTFNIPDSVTSISKWAFCSSTSLKTVYIGNRVTSIGEQAFNGCSDLTSVTIGDSVTSW